MNFTWEVIYETLSTTLGKFEEGKLHSCRNFPSSPSDVVFPRQDFRDWRHTLTYHVQVLVDTREILRVRVSSRRRWNVESDRIRKVALDTGSSESGLKGEVGEVEWTGWTRGSPKDNSETKETLGVTRLADERRTGHLHRKTIGSTTSCWGRTCLDSWKDARILCLPLFTLSFFISPDIWTSSIRIFTITSLYVRLSNKVRKTSFCLTRWILIFWFSPSQRTRLYSPSWADGSSVILLRRSSTTFPPPQETNSVFYLSGGGS